MKKINYFIALCVSVFLWSCSQDETIDDKASQDVLNEDLITIFEYGDLYKVDTEKLIAEKPELYMFGNPNSELWQNESMLRSSEQPSLPASGFDYKSKISSGKVMYSRSTPLEPRIKARTTYIYNLYRYTKRVQIPRGATFIMPPQNIMSSLLPMGDIPGTKTPGYSYELISSNSIHDTYHLYTEVREITHTLYGERVASDNDPIYEHPNYKRPSNFIYKYQYSLINW